MSHYLDFWGKTRRVESGVLPYPLAYHSLDVAAVGLTLVRNGAARMPPPWNTPGAFNGLAVLLAVHDIGKFSRTFQCKVPEFWPAALGPFAPAVRSHGHDTTGFRLLTGRLEDVRALLLPDWDQGDADALLRAVCGHHGRPPSQPDHVSREEACGVCLHAARCFTEAAIAAIGGATLEYDPAQALNLAWMLAGLAVLADWIGSNESWFTPEPAGMTLAAYWIERALPQAERAVAAAGVLPSRVSAAVALADLARHAKTQAVLTPTPLQHLAATLDLAPGAPCLIVIEDQTGAGKTEAALLLAHRLMASGASSGLFLALPTMATANAMYARLANAYRALFVTEDAPSLMLTHGARGLDEAYQKSILPEFSADAAIGMPVDAAEQDGAAQCAAWIASDRRRAFLADVGTGTIDQALLAVLPARHAALRLLGLSQRVLIVDEAHAYDAYMSTELETLVEFQAGMGGSTIILSATLPLARRRALTAAFGRGTGGSAPSAMAYPLLTIASAGALCELPCAPRAELGRRVRIERIDSPEAVLARISAAARAGLAVAWVRNAVDDAIEGYTALRQLGVEAALFHARFAMGDRLEIEARAVEQFGRTSEPAARCGKVLVATQVIEQSLDLDFDFLVSDLAPIDLVIQRAGRLWRHPDRHPVRPPAAAEPVLLLVSPEPAAQPGADWLAGTFARTGRVYPDPAVLWRSARALCAAGAIDTPGDVRRLIEAVYAAEDETPAGLREAEERAQGKGYGERSMAGINLLKWNDGYVTGPGWGSDVHTPTRLSEPSVTFRLARWQAGELRPWCAAPRPALAWALSEISLAAWRASRAPDYAGALGAAVAAARQGWGRWDQEMPLLALTESAEGWQGMVAADKGAERPVVYDTRMGLIFT